MKHIFLLLSLLGLISSVNAKPNPAVKHPTTLQGTVTDIETKESLPGVNIYFPDLKTGTVTDINGFYTIKNLPSTNVTIQISYIGYKSISKSIDLNTIDTLNFALQRTHAEMNEVVITGQNQARERRRTPTPVTKIGPKALIQSSADNIVATLANQPGISQISTGPGISKPVIRGLGYNRVVVVKDGIKQEGQQWGDEHGLEVDQYAVQSAEILKGPASVMYGSDAMAGVINLQSAHPLPEGKFGGSLLMNYQTNNGLLGYSAALAGNKNGFIWNGRFSAQSAHAYQNQYDGYVYNSGFKSIIGNATVGLNKSWGYSHLHLSAYHLTPEIIEGERDSLSGKFVKSVINPNGTESTIDATNEDFITYNANVPYQNVNHYKAVWENSVILGKSLLKATFGLQQNLRKEYEEVAHPNRYGLFLKLNTFNYSLLYKLPSISNWSLSFGANGMAQNSKNEGSEFLVPDYSLFDFGGFFLASKEFGNLNLSGGLRFDTRHQNGESLYLDSEGNPTSPESDGSIEKFTAFTTDYSAFSGSLGATYQLSEKWFTKLNASRGYRAPNIAEIGSNGVHEGTQHYEIGDPDLKAEHSLQIDYALGMNSEHITAELDLFTNNIENYIYTRKLNSAFGGDSISEGVPAYKYVSGNALISGGEVSIDIHPHPLDWLHFENTFSYVNSIQHNQPDSMRYLPQTPPAKWTSELKAEASTLGKHFENSFISLSLHYYFAQNHIFSAYDTETPTPAYALFNVSLGTDVIYHDEKICSVYFSADNIFDKAYQSHMSRLKYLDVNNATGRMGVYNMGRNFSLKVVIPFGYETR